MMDMKTPVQGVPSSPRPREEPVPGSDGKLVILRETPSERACSVLEAGVLMWPSRVRKLVLTDDALASVMGAKEQLR